MNLAHEHLSERPPASGKPLNPLAKYAAEIIDPNSDPVIVAVAIRGKAVCDVAIPRDKFDPFVLLEMIHAHQGVLH